MTVQVNKYNTRTDESVILPSRLMDSVCGGLDVSDFINDGLGNVFFFYI